MKSSGSSIFSNTSALDGSQQESGQLDKIIGELYGQKVLPVSTDKNTTQLANRIEPSISHNIKTSLIQTLSTIEAALQSFTEKQLRSEPELRSTQQATTNLVQKGRLQHKVIQAKMLPMVVQNQDEEGDDLMTPNRRKRSQIVVKKAKHLDDDNVDVINNIIRPTTSHNLTNKDLSSAGKKDGDVDDGDIVRSRQATQNSAHQAQSNKLQNQNKPALISLVIGCLLIGLTTFIYYKNMV